MQEFLFDPFDSNRALKLALILIFLPLVWWTIKEYFWREYHDKMISKCLVYFIKANFICNDKYFGKFCILEGPRLSFLTWFWNLWSNILKLRTIFPPEVTLNKYWALFCTSNESLHSRTDLGSLIWLRSVSDESKTLPTKQNKPKNLKSQGSLLIKGSGKIF